MGTWYGHKACLHYPASALKPWSSHEKMPQQLQMSALWDPPAQRAGYTAQTEVPGWRLRAQAALLLLLGRWGEGTPLLQARARSLLLQRFLPPRSPLQEASLTWWCDAAWRQHMPPPLLRTPALTTTGLPRGRLFSLESPTLGYLHPFLRERQEVVWIRAIYSYLHPSPSQAPCPVPWWRYLQLSSPAAHRWVCSTLLGWQVGTRNPGCPGGQGPLWVPSLASCLQCFPQRQKWCCPHMGTCRKQREDRSLGKPVASLQQQQKP